MEQPSGSGGGEGHLVYHFTKGKGDWTSYTIRKKQKIVKGGEAMVKAKEIKTVSGGRLRDFVA